MPQFGEPGGRLSGVESRAQRAAMNLERRHISVLCSALALWDQGDAQTSMVSMWERNHGGYPPGLCDTLRLLDQAVDNMAAGIAADAVRDGGGATLQRPKGFRRIHQLLQLETRGLSWGETVVAALDAEGGDFWNCLADAATTRAAAAVQTEGGPVRVAYDSSPGGL